MKLKVAYCSTVDGMGKDIIDEVEIENLRTHSTLPFSKIMAYSIHKQDNNLIDCVCGHLNIEQIQLFYIEFV